MSLSSSVSATDNGESTAETSLAVDARPVCMYRNAATKHRWRKRLELSDLKIGQELQAVVVQQKDRGVTGPKLWVDCGVGRCFRRRSRQHSRRSSSTKQQPEEEPEPEQQQQTGDDSPYQWKMVFAMLRMGHRNTKESVARKKAAKLRAKTHGFPVYVSRIRLAQDQFEVVLQPDQVPSPTVPLLQSSSQLRAGDEVRGTVVRVEPYGCLVALDGYNRPGLLHIQRVADLYGRYIDRVTGLEEAGLERRSRVRLQVVSNERKRLFLDFTDDVKQEAAAAAEAEPKAKNGAKSAASSTTVSTDVSSEMSAQELAEWEAHYSDDGGDDDEEDEDEVDGSYDDYDEERDIEDALGLGTY